MPLAFDLDVSFVRSPALADRTVPAFPESGFQLRRGLSDLAVNDGMIDRHAALRHYCFKIPIAER